MATTPDLAAHIPAITHHLPSRAPGRDVLNKYMMKALPLLLCASLLAAQSPAVPRNPFAGVETIILPNGLKVWFKRLPGEPNVAVNFSVSVGSDQDPAGKQQLAHFLEHMLFADHNGKTTLEIKREVEDRGGAVNGFTAWDHTAYHLDIDKAHALFAIDWLGRLASPHAMDSAVVAREREPVAVEVRAVPRKPLDWVIAWYVDPPWLRLPDFWRREFGMTSARVVGDVDFFRSLHRIGPSELRTFYERWYAPDRMTLMIAGDMDRDSALAVARTTFGALAARPAALPADSVTDPAREHRSYGWAERSSVYYLDRYKVYRRSAADDIRLEFIAELLGQRLNNLLRFGERKAAYGVSAYVTRRRGVAVLTISANFKESEFAWARGVIDDEISAIRDGTLSDSVFAAERASLARTLRVQTANARALAGWSMNAFYDPLLHRDFPDMVAGYESVTRDEVGELARNVLSKERRVVQTIAPLPLPQGALVVGLILILAGAGFMARRVLVRPVDITRLRYMARFRLSPVHRVVMIPAAVALVAVALRLLVQVYLELADRWITAIPSFWLQWSIYGAFGSLTLFLMIVAASRWPRKLLVFEGSVSVKYLSYRVVCLSATDIAELSALGFREVWLSRRLWRCTPLAFGLLRPAIYLRQTDGRSWYFNVRDVDECMAVLAPFRPRPTLTTP